MKFNYIFLLTILLATYTLGCTGGGGGANIKDVAKIVPESYVLTYFNVEKLKEDEDLKILLDDLREDFESKFYNLCSFDEVSWTAFASSARMSIYVIGGNIDMDNFRENLKKQGYEKSSYSDVEFWSSRYGSEVVAIVGDKIIFGLESGVKKTINVMKGEEKSMYEGEAKEVIDRLPDGILQVVSFRMGSPWGISASKETSDTLKVAGFMMFSDDREAEKSETSVRQLLETNRDAFDIEVRRDGKFIVFNEKFRVEDYKSIGKELIPGFEAVFAIAGLIAGIYLFRRIGGGNRKST